MSGTWPSVQISSAFTCRPIIITGIRFLMFGFSRGKKRVLEQPLNEENIIEASGSNVRISTSSMNQAPAKKRMTIVHTTGAYLSDHNFAF